MITSILAGICPFHCCELPPTFRCVPWCSAFSCRKDLGYAQGANRAFFSLYAVGSPRTGDGLNTPDTDHDALALSVSTFRVGGETVLP
jgi:hypothetical protein